MAVRDLTLPALGPRLSEFARRSGLAGFWPWWTAQLNALVPAKPRAALERRRMRPVLVFDGDHATLWRPGMEGERAVMLPATTVTLTGDAATVAGAGRAALASLANDGYGASAVMPKVVLSVPPRDVLRKTLALPAAVEPNLRQTLAYDLDRHTPFKAEELYFDAVVVGRNPEKKEIRVDLVSCRKAVVDAAMRHATAWGAAVSAAVPEPPATASASRLNLLPHEARSSLAVWKRWQFWLPLALVAAVALAAIAIPLWQKRDYAIALNALAADARTQANVSDALRTELETKVGDYNFALEKKYAFPSAFRVVDEMSRVLPDDTWLTQMEMKTIAKGKETQREILVRGETANAGRLVQLVEESPLFAQTAPRSPTTKIQPGPGEIFDLGAQLKPLAAPAQVALLANREGRGGFAAPAATPAVSDRVDRGTCRCCGGKDHGRATRLARPTPAPTDAASAPPPGTPAPADRRTCNIDRDAGAIDRNTRAVACCRAQARRAACGGPGGFRPEGCGAPGPRRTGPMDIGAGHHACDAARATAGDDSAISRPRVSRPRHPERRRQPGPPPKAPELRTRRRREPSNDTGDHLAPVAAPAARAGRRLAAAGRRRGAARAGRTDHPASPALRRRDRANLQPARAVPPRGSAGAGTARRPRRDEAEGMDGASFSRIRRRTWPVPNCPTWFGQPSRTTTGGSRPARVPPRTRKPASGRPSSPCSSSPPRRRWRRSSPRSTRRCLTSWSTT